jgi:hypothetical protein
MANLYTFSLDNFHVDSAMAGGPIGWGKDTDWVYFTVKVGDQIHGPIHQLVGDVGNGETRALNWTIGPLLIGYDVPVIVSYQVINNGHGDTGAQTAADLKFAGAISSGLATITGAIFPPVGAVVGAVAAALNAIASVVPNFDPNCDGTVLNDAISTYGRELAAMSASQAYRQSRHYTGPSTPNFCGSNAEYDVTCSISRTNVPTVALPGEFMNVVIISKSSGLCLDVPPARQEDGVVIQQYPINNGRNQQWRLQPAAAGTYTITSLNTIGDGLIAKCLDIPDGSTSPKTLVQQFRSDGGSNQEWRLEPTDDGDYFIVNAKSGLYLDVPDANLEPVNIQQYPPNGHDNQKWTLAGAPFRG